MKHYMQRCIYVMGEIKDIRPIAALLSVLALLIAVNSKDPLNNDGILYLQSAEAFARSGWQAAMEVYPWPFYSILIAWLGKLSYLSFEHAAYVLNATLLVIIVTTFITLLTELGASRTIQFLGALIILGHPRLHHYQNYIIRDFGYWAFSLLSVLYFIRYYRNLRWRYALGWGICISFATLFRIEGAVLCCLSPLVLLVRSNIGLRDRFGQTLKAYTVHGIILSILLIWWLAMPDGSGAQLGRLEEFWYQMQNGLQLLSNNIKDKAVLISETVLDERSKGWGLTMTISGLAGIYFHRAINTLGPLHALLCGHAACKKLIPIYDGAEKVLMYLTLLNLAIPAIALGQSFYLSHRFLMLASLLLLLWSPFSLNSLFQQWQDKRRVLTVKSLLFPFVVLAFSIMLVYAFVPLKESKAYIISAGTWLKHNMPLQARLYSNSEQISFYAKRQSILWYVFDDAAPEWIPDDFVALKVRKVDYERVKKELIPLKLRHIKVFANQEGDKVIILKVSNFLISPPEVHVSMAESQI